MSVLDDFAYDCARFIMNKSCVKVPIKKTDISKYIHSVHSELSNAETSSIIEKAKALLENVYDIKMVNVTSKSGKSYILIMKEDLGDKFIFNKQTYHELLVGTLAHIFMSGGVVREDNLWIFLEKADLMKQNDFDKRKILTNKFTKELYLQYEKLDESEYGGFVFKWGERAMLELSQMSLLEKIAKAFDRTPEYWFEQYETAKKQKVTLDDTQPATQAVPE